MRLSTRISILSTAATAALLGVGSHVRAQDNLVQFIDAATATNSAALGAWGYDPATDSAYVASFGATGSLRKITNVTSGAPQVATPMVSEAQWNLYYRDGDPNTSAGTQLPGGLLLNPLTIGSGTTSIAPYSRAWIIDGVRVPATGTVNATRSKRLYDYNLQMVLPNPIPGHIPEEPPFYDGRDVFTTKVTLADMNAAAGQAPDNATSNVSRQFAWSGDGQRIYFNDSSTPLGGIWKANPQSGAVSRIHANPDILTEPAVKQVSPGTDRIFFRGTDATGNSTDGIDYIDHDGTTTSAPATLISGQAVRDFMETSATLNVTAIAADANGDLYFNVSGGNAASLTLRRNVLRLDPQGRLSKVLAYNERDLFYTGEVGGATNPTANVAKMQPRTATYVGGTGSFALAQVMYAEQSTLNRIGGFWAFKAGDFDRDNDVDQADVALFKTKLTVRGQAAATADLKFDLTGNNAVDWKDVKTLQQFYEFPDGDANIDRTVNLSDFNVLASNFGQGARVWTQGDFNGDDQVNLADFNILASHFGEVASGPTVTPQDWARLGAAVPEPAAVATLSMLATGLVLRRRRRAVRSNA